MNKNEINHLIEYLSPTLILSYFFIHNILLVLIGISFSLYLINIDFINIFIKSINTKLANKKISRGLDKNNNSIKVESNQKKLSKEDSKLTLVETIEEIGFIPSIDKNNDINAA